MVPIKEFQLTQLKIESIQEAYEHYKQTSENKMIKKTDDGNLHIKLTEYKQNGVDWLIITAIPDRSFTAEINKNIQTSILLSIMALFISIFIYKKMTDVILEAN